MLFDTANLIQLNTTGNLNMGFGIHVAALCQYAGLKFAGRTAVQRDVHNISSRHHAAHNILYPCTQSEGAIAHLDDSISLLLEDTGVLRGAI